MATPTMAEVKLAEAAVKTEARRFDLQIKRGQYVSVEEMTDAWRSRGVMIRDSLLAIPDRLSPRLAAESSPRAIRKMLMTELDRALRACAEDIVAG